MIRIRPNIKNSKSTNLRASLNTKYGITPITYLTSNQDTVSISIQLTAVNPVTYPATPFVPAVKLPKTFKFIADGYPAYPLAAQQFALNKDNPLNFDIGLTNDDAVSKEFRPFKQMVERLNRTFKASYRCTCGYDNFVGSNYAVALWICYYNFLRPHKFNSYQILNKVDMLESADTMPGKWQLFIYLGQKTVAHIKSQQANA